MKKLALLTIAFSLAVSLTAQRRIINIPDIPGYVTIKCDLHMHTVFSDGIVWPTYRVNEAWEDGLDAIAITDHIEYQPKKNYIPVDHNAAWKIARRSASEKNIILIHSTEITGHMPPGHLNAMFVDDASVIENDSTLLEIEAAASQGAYIQWNHPGWKSQEPDGIPKMYDVIRGYIDRGVIHGIELFNDIEYYPNILEWCRQYNLSVIASSDIHDIISERYGAEKIRPMTLAFATERSPGALKDALMNGRTVAWFMDKLAGKEEYLSAVFNASVKIGAPFHETETREWIEVTNSSDVPFYLVDGGKGVPRSLTLKANSVTVVRIEKGEDTDPSWTVNNLMTGTKDRLRVTLSR